MSNGCPDCRALTSGRCWRHPGGFISVYGTGVVATPPTTIGAPILWRPTGVLIGRPVSS